MTRSNFAWQELPALPDAHGFAGAFAGMSGKRLIVAGGANFPDKKPWEGGTKVWHDNIFLLNAEETSWTLAGQLPRPVAYGASLTVNGGVLCIGGEDSSQAFADVFLMSTDGASVEFEKYPSLPAPRTNAAAVILKNTVYIMGGTERPGATSATNSVLSLDLTDRASGWKEVEPWPGPPRMLAVAAAVGDSIYLCGGTDLSAGPDGKPIRTYLRDAYKYTPGSGWKQIADMPRSAVAAASPAPSTPPSEFYIVGGDDGKLAGTPPSDTHPGFPSTILKYHAVVNNWTELATDQRLPVTLPMVADGTRFILPSGEIRPGVRTPAVSSFTIGTARSSFGMLNFISLFVYLAFVMGIGLFCGSGNETSDDYFRGGQRIPWWAAGLSIFATTLSSITYMAVPAKAYAENWVFALANLPILLLAPFIIYFILPVFRRINATSAYEYLERRFNVGVRFIGATSFVLLQLGRMAIVMYLPALALATVTDFEINTCILLMGIITIVYCVIGGIAAVIWTDVVQSFILLGGALLAIVLIMLRIPGGVGGFVEQATADGKFQLANLTWDYTVASLWIVIVGNLFVNLIPYTSDQAVVQRYMTTSDEKKAAGSIWLNGIVAIPATIMFFMVGTGLYVYYKTFPDRIISGSKTDSVFPMFIAWELPAGLGGIVVAGIFAAAQSTISTSMNSMSTVLVKDFVVRLRDRALGEKQELVLARWLTAILGLAGTAGALLLASMDVKSLWDVFLQTLGLTGGALAGLFMLGIFTTRANGPGAIIGAVTSVVTLYFVQKETQLHFFLYAPVGILTCAGVGYAASFLFKRPTSESLHQLTFNTINRSGELTAATQPADRL